MSYNFIYIVVATTFSWVVWRDVEKHGGSRPHRYRQPCRDQNGFNSSHFNPCKHSSVNSVKRPQSMYLHPVRYRLVRLIVI